MVSPFRIIGSSDPELKLNCAGIILLAIGQIKDYDRLRISWRRQIATIWLSRVMPTFPQQRQHPSTFVEKGGAR